MDVGILSPDLRSVEQLLTGDFRYKVPKYQRSFAWGTDEVEELWEDLLSSIDRGGEYFLGTIVLLKKGKEPQEIIDGQQRLACISMMLSAIRNAFLAAGDPRAEQLFFAFLGAKDFSHEAQTNPKLVLNEINNETYLCFIIGSKNHDEVAAALKDKSLHPSNRLLLQAYQYFLKKITSEVANKGAASDDFIVPLIDCIRDCIKVITISVTSEEDASLFFESLNARGKELAISDLAKNRLYLEAGDQVNRAQQLWEQMEAELGRRPTTEFLRHYWIAKKVDVALSLVREKQLYRLITQDVKGKKQATIKLLSDLSTSARDYSRISDYNLWPDDTDYDTEFEEIIKALRRFRVTQCNPILLNTIQYYQTAKDIAKLFRIVAHFSFRYFIVGNQSPGSLEKISSTMAIDLRTGKYSNPKEVADAFRAINPDATFRADFELLVMPRARAGLARYILAKLTNYMSKHAGKSGAEQIANPDAKQLSLEHILPQNPDPVWKASFSKGADPAEYIYRIGNLTLLNTKVNHQVANKSFMEKQKTALKGSSLEINKYFLTPKKWGDKEIEQRQIELAKVALEVWKL